jgi:hypothetical protein
MGLTRLPKLTHLLLLKKIKKSRTKSAKNHILKKVGMSSDSFTDTELYCIFPSSITLDNNSIFSILWSFSCVKFVLKMSQFNNIKKFYQYEVYVTVSSMSSLVFSIFIIFIVMNLISILHNNPFKHFLQNIFQNNVPEENESSRQK